MKAGLAALGEVSEFIRGITFTPNDIEEVASTNTVGVMRTKNVQEQLDLNDVWKINRKFVKNKNQYLEEGDLLVSTANSWNLVGKASWVPLLNYESSFGGFVTVLRGNKKLVDRRYLYYWFVSDRIQELLRSFSNKTTNISNLSLSRAKELTIPLPPLAEQQRIAALLDTADRILKQRESAIAKLDQLAQSVFVDMFSNIEHITTLSQVAELKRGPFGGALKKEIFVKHGPMVYEQRNAIYDDCKNGKYFITEEKFNEMKDFSVIDNDLIVSCSGTLGKVAKIDKESPRGIINQALLRVRPKKNISSSFLKSAIESVSVQRNLAISSHGSGLQNFPPMAVVKAVPIPLPSFELQMKFESIKEEILKKKIDLINSKNNLENLLKSLQNQSFAVN